jgi:hypothetical protein
MDLILDSMPPANIAYIALLIGIAIGGLIFFIGFVLGSMRGYQDAAGHREEAERLEERFREWCNFSRTENEKTGEY